MLNKRYYSHIYVILISFTSASVNCYFANSSEKCQYWLIQFLLALIHSHCSIWLSLTVDTTAYLHIHSLTKKFNKKAWCTLLKPHFHPNYGLYLPLWANTPPPPLTTATVAQSITPVPQKMLVHEKIKIVTLLTNAQILHLQQIFWKQAHYPFLITRWALQTIFLTNKMHVLIQLENSNWLTKKISKHYLDIYFDIWCYSEKIFLVWKV